MRLFAARAFYLQVVKYGYYHEVALNDQLKQFEVPSTRGVIRAQQGTGTVPLVLNQKLYTVYADPSFVKEPDKRAAEIAAIIGGSAAEYAKQMKQPGRYAVLARIVVKSVDLSHAPFLRSDRILPVKQIRDRTARVSQGTESRLAVQLGEPFFYLHCLGIKTSVSVKCISVIDPENAVADCPRDILRIDRQYQ